MREGCSTAGWEASPCILVDDVVREEGAGAELSVFAVMCTLKSTPSAQLLGLLPSGGTMHRLVGENLSRLPCRLLGQLFRVLMLDAEN